jgi:hypothetical protein
MTLIVEVAPVEAGGDEIEEIAAHDLSTISLDGLDIIPVLALRSAPPAPNPGQITSAEKPGQITRPQD